MPCNDQRPKQFALAVCGYDVTTQTPELVRFVEEIEARQKIGDILKPFDKDKPAGEEHFVESRLQGLVNLRKHSFWLYRLLARGHRNSLCDFIE